MTSGAHHGRSLGADPSSDYARFVRWLLAAVAIAVVALLAALWWLDPTSVTGRTTRFSVVANGGVRQAKLDLMERLPAPPDVLILGSSRSMQLDPADVTDLTGGTAFNGAVSGGTSKDMYLYARYAEQLWGDDYPHLVLGVVTDVLRPSGTAGLDPRLKRFLPRDQQDRDALEVADELLRVQTLDAAQRALRHVVPRDGAGSLLDPTGGTENVDAGLATTGRQKNNRLDLLEPDGMTARVTDDQDTGTLQQRIDRQMQEYLANSFAQGDTFTGTSTSGVYYLRRTIQIANSHGDVPVLWVTPFNPAARTRLPAAYAERDAAFRDAIRTLQGDDDLKFTFVSATDDLASFGGVPADFHDGIHMMPANTRRVLEYLQREGLLE
ncbi:MAG: hypothetical protein KDC46_06000 [Thermoleophilia bacterium]|nr:hypothetical protein [Thermoleophilia bacterium]